MQKFFLLECGQVKSKLAHSVSKKFSYAYLNVRKFWSELFHEIKVIYLTYKGKTKQWHLLFFLFLLHSLQFKTAFGERCFLFQYILQYSTDIKIFIGRVRHFINI